MLPLRYRPDPICAALLDRALARFPALRQSVRTDWGCEGAAEIREIAERLYRRSWPRTAACLPLAPGECVRRALRRLHRSAHRSAQLSPAHWLLLFEVVVGTVTALNRGWYTTSPLTVPQIALGGHTVARVDAAAFVQLYFPPLDVLRTPPGRGTSGWQAAARRLCRGETPRTEDLGLRLGPGPVLAAPISLDPDPQPVYPPLVVPLASPRGGRAGRRGA
jgi:hypothetical protein